MTEYKERGNEAYQAGNFSEAVDLYTEGIEQEPNNAALFSNRSAAYLNLGEHGKAKRDAEICIELNASWSKGWWRKGTAQFEDQDYKGARETFNKGLVHCPGNDNLIAGVEKANKFIAAVDSVQGPGEAAHQFNLDDPSQRTIDQPPPTPASGADTTSATAADTGTDANKAAGATPSTKPADAGTAESKNSPQWPGSAEAEIERIKAAPNHYATLHVSTDADNSQMKKNYYALARMLHPDKCQLEGADNAMTSVSQAYDTLTNVLKKTLYDQFLSQTGDDAEHPNQTYQEWESRQQPVEMPKWLNVLLGIKGCGWILAILVMLVLTPILLLLILVYIIFAILCLPFRLFIRICFPERYAEMKKQHERELAKMEEQTQDRIFAHV